MKPHALLSCFFAAYGVYLTASSLFAVMLAFFGILMASQFSQGEPFAWTVARYSLSLVPLVVGIVLVLFSRRLGALSAKYAGLSDDARCEFHLVPRDLLAVLLAVIGVYLAATQGAAMVRVLYLLFEVKAGSREIAESATRDLPEGTQVITHAVCVGAGVAIAKKCRTIAGMLIR
jgi:hypothetical protein